MRITVDGELGKGVTAKDVALYMMSKMTTSGATGYFVEYAGSAIRNLTMEGRLTLCNLSIEMGARGGMVAPDEVTFEYIKGRENAPQGEAWDQAMEYWKTLKSDDDAVFDQEVRFDAADIEPMIRTEPIRVWRELRKTFLLRKEWERRTGFFQKIDGIYGIPAG